MSSSIELIRIPHEVLKHNLEYLTANGYYDILGCLMLHRGIELPDKIRLPSQLNVDIHPFTVRLRRKVIDTELSVGLLRLQLVTRAEAIKKANQLLLPYYMQIETYF